MNGSYLLMILVAVVIIPNLLGWLLRSQTQAKGRFGIGTFTIECPNCQNPQPIFRKPTSVKQMMFGGWTCKACGAEINKYGAQEA
jgi:ribosomal protein S27E